MAVVGPGSRGEPVTRIVAHRGDRAHAPENTLRAFESARRAGCDSIELDLQLSADGELVVFHDATLDRLTEGRGRVGAHTVAELEDLAVSPGRFEPGPDTRICRLAEVLDWAGDELPLYLELKLHDDDDTKREALLAAALRTVPAEAPHALASFDETLVAGVLDAGRRGVLIGRSVTDLRRLGEKHRSKLQAFSLHFAAIGEDIHRRLAPEDFELWTWTVNDRRDFLRLQSIGVDAICSDDPAAARRWREEAR